MSTNSFESVDRYCSTLLLLFRDNSGGLACHLAVLAASLSDDSCVGVGSMDRTDRLTD